MRNKKFISIVCIILAVIFVATLILGAISSAWAVSQSDIDALKNKQSAIAQQKTALQSQIDSAKGQVSDTQAQKAELDEKNQLAQQEIDNINEQIAAYDKLISEKAEELKKAQAAEDEQKEALEKRMRAMEETPSLTYVAIIFQSADFSDLLSKINDISAIMTNDKELEDKYTAARQEVETVKNEYEQTQNEQKQTKVELDAKKADLEAQIAQANQVIASLESNIEAFKQQYEAEETQEAAIRSQIDQQVAALEAQQRAAAEAAKKNGTSYTVTNGTGQFTWPVPASHTISSPFGYRVHPIFGTTKFHSGIDISASSGSTIVAADSGTVLTATYSSSYGNYVVISHGNGTSTLYAHMSKLGCSAGQSVSKGSTIGYVGSTGWSTGPHCHFEIRINGSLVNPASYF